MGGRGSWAILDGLGAVCNNGLLFALKEYDKLCIPPVS